MNQAKVRDTERFDLLDPKLLNLFELIYNTGSVTRAGAIMGQNQPTVSAWLSKLRTVLNDPLFVRTPKGMLPNPRAEALIAQVREVLRALMELKMRQTCVWLKRTPCIRSTTAPTRLSVHNSVAKPCSVGH